MSFDYCIALRTQPADSHAGKPDLGSRFDVRKFQVSERSGTVRAMAAVRG